MHKKGKIIMNTQANQLSPSHLYDLLSKNSDYRILRRMPKIKEYNPDNGEKKLIGIFLDVETTGLDYRKDKIIELSLVPFEFTKDGKIFRILESYSSFQDPGIALSEETKFITGITDDMISGCQIDKEKLETMVKPATLIVAHNAAFDRNFVEAQFEIFKTKYWACTQTQIAWNKERINSSKLEFISSKLGFFYDAHRAEEDCLAGIHLLTQTLPVTGELVFKKLLENARKDSCRIWAKDAKFELKDRLKERNYKYFADSRTWFKDIPEDLKAQEIEFLQQEIYNDQRQVKIDKIIPINRFSNREFEKI